MYVWWTCLAQGQESFRYVSPLMTQCIERGISSITPWTEVLRVNACVFCAAADLWTSDGFIRSSWSQVYKSSPGSFMRLQPSTLSFFPLCAQHSSSQPWVCFVRNWRDRRPESWTAGLYTHRTGQPQTVAMATAKRTTSTWILIANCKGFQSLMYWENSHVQLGLISGANVTFFRLIEQNLESRILSNPGLDKGIFCPLVTTMSQREMRITRECASLSVLSSQIYIPHCVTDKYSEKPLNLSCCRCQKLEGSFV